MIGSLESLIGEDGETRRLVRTAPGVQMPEQYRTAPEKCDHCQTARRRTLTFVLQHEDGRTTQVGSTCINEFCGDGTVQVGLGEECDDGNNVSNDGCNATCQNEYCGDGVLQELLGEQCDDGNNSGGDGCDPFCQDELVPE